MALSDAAASVVGAWTLDEASGTRADQVNNYDLTDNNTVASAAGKHGNAADFESANSEYLNAASNHADLDGGDVDLMLSCWVQLESKAATQGIMTKWGDTGGGASRNRCYRLFYDQAADRFQFEVGSIGADGGTSVNADTFGSPSTATWYLLHAWHDATNNLIGISVNAGTANTASHSLGVRSESQVFAIGATQTGGPPGASYSSHFDGLIDDATWMRGRFLDATERTEHYNTGNGVAFEDWAAAATPYEWQQRYDVVRAPARLTPHPTYVWPVGIATAEAVHVDAWQQPYRLPHHRPATLVHEPRWCGVLEPSLFSAPPGVSWWAPASEPVRVRPELVKEGAYVRCVELSYVTPPGLGWSAPVELPMLPRPILIRPGETRVDIVAPAAPAPELSWYQPASEPARTKPPPRWQWATLIVGVDLSGYISTANTGIVSASEVFVSALVKGQMFEPGLSASEVKQG